ncbi:hypothetical protein [uncultured Dialister sp.]|nr:hypothetical protein [uncultured Dialister sp.]
MSTIWTVSILAASAAWIGYSIYSISRLSVKSCFDGAIVNAGLTGSHHQD